MANPDFDKARAEAEQLKTDLERHNYLYHTLDTPEISDEEYDRMFSRLAELERNFPDLVTHDSPTQRIGGALLPYLETGRHSLRMYGLENVFSLEEWSAFVLRAKRALAPHLKDVLKDLFVGDAEEIVSDVNARWSEVKVRALTCPVESIPESTPTAGLIDAWWLEPKLDGAAVELVYANGVLDRALTRGDGTVGEVVTEAMRTVRNVPVKLRGQGEFPEILEVRGEVLMFRKDFLELNRSQEVLGLRPFANPRNAAAGSLRQLDTSITASRRLRFFAYGAGLARFAPGRTAWNRQSEMMAAFADFGFAVPEGGKLCRSLREAGEYYERIAAGRDDLPYEIDGVVCKLDDLRAQQALAFTARAPRFAAAWKFAARQARTRLNKISVTVGRTGIITPGAELAPVNVGGVTVSRASLHNEDQIKSLDIREGDMVIVQRAGDVIPEVVGPVLEERPAWTKPYDFPQVCPVCGRPAFRHPGEAAWRCSNSVCPAIIKGGIEYFVSKAGLDVKGMGEKWIEILIADGRVKTPADLFTLTEADLMRYERMGEVLAAKFVTALAEARQSATLAKLIAALGIMHVGSQTAQALAGNFADLDDLARADMDRLMQIPDIGPEVAGSIRSYFALEANQVLLARFRAMGLWPERKTSEPGERTGLSGKKVLFTGTLSRPRNEFQLMAEAAGAKLVSAVSGNLDYLIVGDNPGSKLAKATNLGITVLSEERFLILLKPSQ